MKQRFLKLSALVCAVLCLCALFTGCGTSTPTVVRSGGADAVWTMGFASEEIAIPQDDSQPYYIAGYNNGWKPDGVLDLCRASAVWMDTGDGGVLLIGIDCVGLGGTDINEIRDRLASFCKQTGCTAVNVYSTHTHAGVDTLGLWGPTMVNGKNDEYTENLMNAAVAAAKQAYENRTEGRLYIGQSEVPAYAFRDSRLPEVYDPNLYQIRFAPTDASRSGIRMYLFGAHAESLRGSNTFISRDFPSVLCDTITETTGDDAMFMAGAIGGLIMTQVLDSSGYQYNMHVTGDLLVEHALSITPAQERELLPVLQYATTEFELPLDNVGYMIYKFLGILENEVHRDPDSATGYGLTSEMTLLQLGDALFCLMPGEIFPELVWGGEYGDANPDGKQDPNGAENPAPLAEIAAGYGYDQLLVVGLSNDELGYIVSPSDFLVNPKAPYLLNIEDYKFENHYEETNSVGPQTAPIIADVFAQLCAALAED